jgi:hypothetical protein
MPASSVWPPQLCIPGILKKPLPLIPVLAYIGCLYGFSFSTLALTYPPLRPIDFHLRRSGTYDILLVLWLVSVAYCIGRRFLRLLGISSQSGIEGLIFPAAAGIALFSWLTMILSLVHGLYRPVAYTLLLLPTAIWHDEMRHYPCDLWRALATRLKRISWSAESLGYCFLVVYIGAALGLIFISALGPSLEYDDLNYHLAGPKNYVQNHRLVSLPDTPHLFFPKNVEMLHTFALLLHNDITAKLLGYLLGVGTILLVYAFCARFLARGAGMVAATILVASPIFIWEMRTAHNDIGLTLYIFIGAYATILWQRNREAPWLRFAIFCLAFSLGVKYWALLALGIIMLLVFAMHLAQSRALMPAVRAVLKLGLYSSLGLVPWGLVNLFYTGNPVFPLFNSIFHSPYWTNFHTYMARIEMFKGGVKITLSNLWDLATLLWKITTDPQGRFSGNIGPFYVVLLPLLLLIPKAGPEFWLLFAFSIIYYIGFAVSDPLVRFLFPALPGLAAAAAVATKNLLRILGRIHKFIPITVAVILAALAIWTSPFFERYGSGSRYGSGPLATLPIDYLIGRESRSDYLVRFYPGIRAIEFLNRIPGAKKVYYAHASPDGFYLNGTSAYHYSPFFSELMTADADRAHKILLQNGITHVVVAQPGQPSIVSSRQSDLTHWYLRELAKVNAHIVYEVLPDRVVQDEVTYDFLENLNKAHLTSPSEGKGSKVNRNVRWMGNGSRYSMEMVAPSTAEFQVDVPSHATLSFAVGTDNPGCAGKRSFRIWIKSPDAEESLAYKHDIEGSNAAPWIENQVDLSIYAGNHVVVGFEADGASCCGYFWADPVLIAKGRTASDDSRDNLMNIGGSLNR